MINLVAEYCENCLQNLYRFLQNLNFAIFCSKTMWIFVYISFETSLVIGVSLQLGTLRKKTPILSSTRIHIVLLKVNFIFMYILERKRRNVMKPKLAWLPVYVCSFRINWHLLCMIMLIFSILIFLPYCIVEMYGTANISQGWV